MLSGLFQQGMTHQNALDNSFIGLLSESVVELISSHFSALSTRPDYDWNKGGGVIRKNAIKIERKRTGINDSHGFHVKYNGQGYLRNHIVTR